MNKLLLLSAVLFSFSCTKKGNDAIEIKYYEPKEPLYVVPETISVFPDTFVQLGSADFCGDYMAVLDITLCKCFIYENGEMKTAFGDKGEGPGEFNFMQSGIVKFTDDGNVAVFDPMSARLQVFSVNGELLKSLNLGVIGITFEIYDSIAVFAPLMGKNLMEFYNINTGEIIKKFEGDFEVNMAEEKLPPPMKVLTGGAGETIWWGFNGEYTIYQYTMEDSAVSGFSVAYEPILFPQEVIDLIYERAGQYRDFLEGRIREYQPPFYFLMFDREKEVLLVIAASDEYTYSIVDIFDSQNNYLKRVKISLGEKIQLLGISGGVAAVFEMDSLRLMLLDVSEIYE
ncbi:hypothetical protein JW890_02735 [candidate division WOR-3 bacterium]|nr:hypothetical protein [candidate division WOR-3 bacterium]